ncbi:hypothetical protein ACQCSX_22805 (plasmid) [Pseudarthrobacter sp. P1]|uniref:hypothetical protein n=1 Tax=Pseudarthrobacter sp. P1 TaxID=3418418 RepID=UPI003CEA9EAA
MKKPFRFIITLGASLAVIAGMAGPASASPPPPGYPTDQIMVTAQNPILGPIPIHRGFWDSVPDQGFGFDKAWNKHNLWSSEAMRRIMLSTNYVMQGNGNYALTAYAGKYTCSGSTCTLTDQRQLTGVHDGRTYSTYYTWPVNGLMGMLTAYCNNPDGAAACPNWVTFSITNPGVTNPYNNIAAKGEASGTAQSSASPSAGPDALERQKVAEPESKELFSELSAGTTTLDFDYYPLPEVIDNPNK